MGSSFRSDMRSGGMEEWETPLRQACAIIRNIEDRVYRCIGDNGQYDDAGDDGALAEKLAIARRLIEEELPAPRPAVSP